MSLTENGSGFTMPVTPMAYGNGGFGNSFGGEGWWILLLILFAGGWNNNGWNGNGGGLDTMYPWITQNTNQGFDQAATASALAGIQTSLTTGFSNAEVSACNRAMTDLQTAYNTQIANMNQSFANQQSLQAQLNNMSAQQAECCCGNKLLISQLSSDIAREACADRQAVNDALRDVISNNTANTQSVLNVLNSGIQTIKDQMFNDKLDAKNERIAALENQLNMAQLASSQNAQTAAIIANNEAQTAALEAYLQPPVRPCYVVPNPNCCSNTYGCGMVA